MAGVEVIWLLVSVTFASCHAKRLHCNTKGYNKAGGGQMRSVLVVVVYAQH